MASTYCLFAGLRLIQKGLHSVQIQLMATAEKVTLNATVESNYHVLNGSTSLHLHPPLFVFCHSLLRRFFGANITLGNACVALQWKLMRQVVTTALQCRCSILIQELSAFDLFLQVHQACMKYSKYYLDWCLCFAGSL